MFDVAVEQIVKVKPPKISILYKVVLIIACVVAATTIPQTMTFGIIVLALYNEHNELVRIFIYPNEELLEAIKQTVDKSVYKVD